MGVPRATEGSERDYIVAFTHASLTLGGVHGHDGIRFAGDM